jgi:hypothetical protein
MDGNIVYRLGALVAGRAYEQTQRLAKRRVAANGAWWQEGRSPQRFFAGWLRPAGDQVAFDLPRPLCLAKLERWLA